LVWEEEHLIPLIREAQRRIRKLYPQSTLDARIYICTLEELRNVVITELHARKITISEIKRVTANLDEIDGKYFKKTHEIWLVQDRGTNLDTIIHELLHSIQKCHLDREDIVYYITYKLTDNPDHINPFTLKDWQEIEQQHKFLFKCHYYSKLKNEK